MKPIVTYGGRGGLSDQLRDDSGIQNGSAFNQEPIIPVAENSAMPLDFLQHDAVDAVVLDHALAIDQQEAILGLFSIDHDGDVEFRQVVTNILRQLPVTDGGGLMGRHRPGQCRLLGWLS